MATSSAQPSSWPHLMLAGSLLWMLSLGVLQVFSIPHLRPYDERAHVAYALSVADGELPTIRSAIPLERLGIRGGKRQIFVANHPPLYYAMVAGPIAIGEHWGPKVAVLVGRLATLLLSTIGLLFVYATVRQLFPKRPDLAVATAAWTATCPSLVHMSSLVHNDGLAFLSCAATAWAGTRLCVQGFSWRAVAALAFAALGATLTRLSGFFAVAPTLLFVGSVLLFFGADSWKVRAKQALVATGAAAALVVAGSAWFYARNYLLYGDVAGASAVLEQFHRRPRGALIDALLNGDLWLGIIKELWGRMAGGVRLDTLGVHVGVGIMVTGALTFVVALLRSGPGLLSDKRRAMIGAGYALTFSLFLFSIFAFYIRGGTPHARYVLPVIWVPWLAFSWGFRSVNVRAALLAPLVGALLGALIAYDYLVALLGKGKTDVAWQALQAAPYSGAVLAVSFLGFALGTFAYLRGWTKSAASIPEGG